MKINKLLIITFACFLAFQNAKAQTPAASKDKNTVISGGFELETASKQKDPTTVNMEATIAFLENLKNKVTALEAGNISKVDNATEGTLTYLSAAYVLCSVDKGACPMYLDSILEADVINSRISKKVDCPNMRGFWKSYLANDMENRHQHLSKVGFLSITSEFNAKERPKYLRCKETVKLAVEGTTSDADFFRSRYSDKLKIAAISNALEAVKNYQAKKINVFNEISSR